MKGRANGRKPTKRERRQLDEIKRMRERGFAAGGGKTVRAHDIQRNRDAER